MATFTNGAFATRGAAGTAGNLFVPSDGFSLYRDDGSVWVPWGPLFPFAAPPTAGWSWVNQGGAAVDEARTVFVLTAPSVAPNQIRCRVRDMAAPSWTMSAFLMGYNETVTVRMTALVLRDSNTGRLITFGFTTVGGEQYRMSIVRWTNATTYSSTVSEAALDQGTQPLFMRVADDNVNFTYSWSADGQNWVQFLQEGRTAWLASPDEYGWCVQASANIDTAAILASWLVE